MAADCCAFRPKGRGLWLALLPSVLSALLPKCPLCLAACLSAFGVTFGMASFALTVLRPLGFAVAGSVLALALWRMRALWPARAASR